MTKKHINLMIMKLAMINLGIVIYMIGIFFIDKLEYMNDTNLDIIGFIFSWLGIIILILSIYSWYKVTDTIISPYTIFYIFFFLFNYGQPLLWAFGIHLDGEIGKTFLFGWNPNHWEVLKTQIISCISLIFFHIGALFYFKKENIFKLKKIDSNIHKSMRATGILMALISVLPTLYRWFKFYTISRVHGYGYLYNSGAVNQGGILFILELFFFPSLMCIWIGGFFNKKDTKLIYIIMSIYIMLCILTGDRSNWIAKLLIMLWLRHKNIKRFNKKEIVTFLILAYLGINILNIITSLRDLGINNIDIADIRTIILDDNIFIGIIKEMGSSMTIALIILRLINGDITLLNGKSYISTIINAPLSRVGNMIGIPAMNLDIWLMEQLNISWGPGFSMVGEALLNFGIVFLPIIMLLMGSFIGMIMFYNNKYDGYTKPIRTFVCAVSCSILFMLPRSSSFFIFKQLFYSVIFVVITILVISYLFKSNSYNLRKE